MDERRKSLREGDKEGLTEINRVKRKEEEKKEGRNKKRQREAKGRRHTHLHSHAAKLLVAFTCYL